MLNIMYRLELAKCIADPACAANIACLQTCNNRPDETECQVVPFTFTPRLHERMYLIWEESNPLKRFFYASFHS